MATTVKQRVAYQGHVSEMRTYMADWIDAMNDGRFREAYCIAQSIGGMAKWMMMESEDFIDDEIITKGAN